MDEKTKQPLRMDAYYFGFEATGAHSVDRILSAVACAGKAYHLTEDWRSECEPYHPEMRGASCADWIQNAATDAATEREELLAALESLVADLDVRRVPGMNFLDRAPRAETVMQAVDAIAKARGSR